MKNIQDRIISHALNVEQAKVAVQVDNSAEGLLKYGAKSSEDGEIKAMNAEPAEIAVQFGNSVKNIAKYG